jgi:hypothetical protein
MPTEGSVELAYLTVGRGKKNEADDRLANVRQEVGFESLWERSHCIRPEIKIEPF